MRIIKPGKCVAPNRQFECKECGCVFEISAKDLTLTYSPAGWMMTAQCPSCGMPGGVSVDEMRKAVRDSIKENGSENH